MRQSLIPLFLLFATTPHSLAALGYFKDCLHHIRHILRPHFKQIYKQHNFKTLDHLFLAFTQGFEADLNDLNQRNAFEIYIKLKFGDSNNYLTTDSLDRVAFQLKKFDILQKRPFREFNIEVRKKSYLVTPITKELSVFLSSQIKSSGQIRGNLFQVDANKGYWKKLLGHRELEKFKINFKNKEERKALQNQMKEDFDNVFNEQFPKGLRIELIDKNISAREKTKKLYEYLIKERKRLQKSGKNWRPISQAIVDLIHTIGYHDETILKTLKGNDNANDLERLRAFRQILEERDQLAKSLGYNGYFNQVLKDLGVVGPSGIADPKKLLSKLQSFEENIIANAYLMSGGNLSKKIRHLSTIESPFRSCIGGTDCASSAYLLKALDPNYHYFTFTDKDGFSSGHVTIVLGEATLNDEQIKVAFLDKVQNIDNIDLPIMIEGVRRSIKEKGYLLVRPEEMGDHNGISNEEATRNFIKNNIEIDQSEVITQFKPHLHLYKSNGQYSRVGNELSIRPVLPSRGLEGSIFKPGELIQPWRITSFNLKNLIKGSVKLKNGSLEDKIRYISFMDILEREHLYRDPLFQSTLSLWLKDKNESFKLRKQTFIYEWIERGKSFLSLLEYFDSKNQLILIQNFIDTPRYQKKIFDDKNTPLSLIVKVRNNKKVRKMIMSVYSSPDNFIISKILDTKDISNEMATDAIMAIKKNFDSMNINNLISIIKLLRGTTLYDEIEKQLLQQFINNSYINGFIGRSLAEGFYSKDLILSKFCKKILAFKKFSIANAYFDLIQFQKNRGIEKLEEAMVIWMKQGDVEIRFKADILMTKIGRGKNLFDHYLEFIPKSEQAYIWKEINRETSFGTFREFAKQRGIKNNLLDEAVLESFQFRRKDFLNGIREGHLDGLDGGTEVILTKSFEMQATPVTQLQWTIVMGENPSYSIDSGKNLLINGKKIKLDINRPVEQVSWEDVQKFIIKLNEFQNEYIYRLPTETEWEYGIRGGTKGRYSFGDNPDNLPLYGWFKDNAHDQARPVAKLRANQYGIYDGHGNVWEWTQDWYREPSGESIDRFGMDTEGQRIIRGGSVVNTPYALRSASASREYPSSKHYYLGLRLVRSLKYTEANSLKK